jgi:hypothetical protein
MAELSSREERQRTGGVSARRPQRQRRHAEINHFESQCDRRVPSATCGEEHGGIVQGARWPAPAHGDQQIQIPRARSPRTVRKDPTRPVNEGRSIVRRDSRPVDAQIPVAVLSSRRRDDGVLFAYRCEPHRGTSLDEWWSRHWFQSSCAPLWQPSIPIRGMRAGQSPIERRFGRLFVNLRLSSSSPRTHSTE